MAGRLKELGYTLSVAAAPQANYVPFAIRGNLLYISGQLPMESGKIAVTGHVGRDVDVAAAQRAAELCAVNSTLSSTGLPTSLAMFSVMRANMPVPPSTWFPYPSMPPSRSTQSWK
jgi:enamine deaminase RidA (YjgF/YER057c/UK114 family)